MGEIGNRDACHACSIGGLVVLLRQCKGRELVEAGANGMKRTVLTRTRRLLLDSHPLSNRGPPTVLLLKKGRATAAPPSQRPPHAP